jgi:hypothetical protein
MNAIETTNPKTDGGRLYSRSVLGNHSTRLSSVAGDSHGQIVVNLNGEGRGAISRAVKPKENK